MQQQPVPVLQRLLPKVVRFNAYQVAGQIMPYKSAAQEKFFNANRKKLEKQGVNVSEWNDASKGKKIPKKVKSK